MIDAVAIAVTAMLACVIAYLFGRATTGGEDYLNGYNDGWEGRARITEGSLEAELNSIIESEQ